MESCDKIFSQSIQSITPEHIILLQFPLLESGSAWVKNATLFLQEYC